MKKRIWAAMLALCLTAACAQAEESFFEEEAFGVESSFAEDFFAEESFFEDETAEPAAEEALPEATIEDRSVIFVPEAETADEDWAKAETTLTGSVAKGKGKVQLTWTNDLPKKLPAGVKYYIYEWAEGAGAWVQVSSPVTAKNVTISGVPAGDHTFMVRPERINKNKTEDYGLMSNLCEVKGVVSDVWKKAPKVKGVQSGVKQATLTWDPKEDADYYEIYRKVKKDWVLVGITEECGWVDGSAEYGANSYKVYPAKGEGAAKELGKAGSVSVEVLEFWKTKPVILSVQDEGEVTVKGKDGKEQTVTLGIGPSSKDAKKNVCRVLVTWQTTVNPLNIEGWTDNAIEPDKGVEIPHAFFVSDGSTKARYTKFDQGYYDLCYDDANRFVGEFQYILEARPNANLSITVQPAMYLGSSGTDETLGELSDPVKLIQKPGKKSGAENITEQLDTDGKWTVSWRADPLNIEKFKVYLLSGSKETAAPTEILECEADAKTKRYSVTSGELAYGSYTWYVETIFSDGSVKKSDPDFFTMIDPDKTAPIFNEGIFNLNGKQEVTFSWEGGSAPYELMVDDKIEEISATSKTQEFKPGKHTVRVREKADGAPWSQELFINVYDELKITVAHNLPATVKPGKNYKFSVTAAGGSGRYIYQLYDQCTYTEVGHACPMALETEADETEKLKASLSEKFDVGDHVVTVLCQDRVTGEIAKKEIPFSVKGPAWYDAVTVTSGAVKATKDDGLHSVTLNWKTTKYKEEPSKFIIKDNGVEVARVSGSKKSVKLTKVAAGEHKYTVVPAKSIAGELKEGKAPVKEYTVLVK